MALGPINSANFVGNNSPVVEPRAITMMSEALRAGLITADEIAERHRMRPLKEAQIADATDPVLVEARKQQTIAGADSAKTMAEAQKLALQQAKMQANIPPIILDQNKELAAQGMQVYPETGGAWNDQKSDEVRQLWKDLKFWEAEFSSAKAQDVSIKDKEITTTGGVFLSPVEEGSTRQADPQRVGQLKDWIRSNQNPRLWIAQGKPPSPSLFGAAPGVVAVSSTPVPAAVAAPMTPAVPGLVPTIPINETPPSPLVTPRVPPAVSAAAVGPPQQGLMIKPPAVQRGSTEPEIKAASAAARFISANETFANLKKAGFDPGSFLNWVQKIVPEPFQTTDLRSFNTAKSGWSQGLLRLESGAAITPGEQEWYERAFFPVGLEPALVQEQKAQMRSDVEKIAAEVARGGNLDVEALLNVGNRAKKLTPAVSAGGSSPKGVKPFTTSSGVRGSIITDPSNPGKQYFIPAGNAAAAPVSSPYVQSETLPEAGKAKPPLVQRRDKFPGRP